MNEAENCPCQILSTMTFMLWDKKFSDKIISNRRPKDLRKDVLLRNAKMELTARYICYSVFKQALESEDDEEKESTQIIQMEPEFSSSFPSSPPPSKAKLYFRRKKRQLTREKSLIPTIPVKKSNLNSRSS